MLVWHGDDDRTLLRQWANDSGDGDGDVAIWRWWRVMIAYDDGNGDIDVVVVVG